MAQELAVTATSNLFARVLETPVVRRLENCGVLSCGGEWSPRLTARLPAIALGEPDGLATSPLH